MTDIRRYIPMLFLSALASSCGMEDWFEHDAYPAPEPQNAAWWNGLTPEERARRLMDRARADDGRYVGEQCKEWLRDVVIEASSGAANLPATCRWEAGEWRRDTHGWAWCPSPYVRHRTVQIDQARPGWVVQMLRWGMDGRRHPHTAMVLSVDGSGIRWIDSNYTAPETVGTHVESIQAFEQSVCSQGRCAYSLYSVGE